jgi:hypothetical protein
VSARRVTRLLRRGAAVVCVAALGVVLVAGAVDVARVLAPSWHAMREDGVNGTFVADESHRTGRGGHRAWRGRFVSDDGSVVRQETELKGSPPGIEIGRPVPAIDTGAERYVFARPAYGAFVETIGNLFVLGVFGLGCGAVEVWLIRRWVRRRAPTATGP